MRPERSDHRYCVRRLPESIEQGGRDRVHGSLPRYAPPSPPSGFTQVATSETAVVLAWTPSADNVGVVGYGVYRDLQRVTTLPEPNVTIGGLRAARRTRARSTPRMRQAIALRSPLRTCGPSACAPSAPAPAPSPSPPSDTTPPSAPTGLTASSVTQTGLTLGWNASTDNVGVTGYDVYRDGAKVASAGTTASSQTGLACGTSTPSRSWPATPPATPRRRRSSRPPRPPARRRRLRPHRLRPTPHRPPLRPGSPPRA